MQILFEKVLARDRLVSIGILPNVNSLKQNRAAKPGISVYSLTTRLTNNQNKKTQEELPFPQRKRKRRQKCCSYCENSQDSASLESQRRTVSRKPDAKSLGIDSTSRIHTSLRYVKQVSGKIKDCRMDKYKSKFLISEVLAL